MVFRTSLLISCTVSICLLTGCSVEKARVPDRCSKVYVMIDEDDIVKREYQQYIPRAQDWAYYQTEIRVNEGGHDMIFGVNRNIYMSRSKDYIDIKGVVDYRNYLSHCLPTMSETDTIYLLIDDGQEVLTEYVVQDVSMISIEKGHVVRNWTDGRSVLLYIQDADLSTWSNGSSAGSGQLTKVSAVECLELETFQFAYNGDTTQMQYLEGIGPILYTKPSGREIRLSAGQLAQLAAEACK